MNVFSLVLGEDKEVLAKKFFSPGGTGFESRPQQIKMAEAVGNALFKKEHLIVEAGTGVGKSLAYLLPLIKWTTGEKKKAVISTYTKTLQEQLVKKDLPMLKNILGADFRYALCLGSKNYLCIRRFRQSIEQYFFDIDKEKEEFSKIEDWFKKTKTGLRSELNFSPQESVWSKICREGDLCLGQKCPFRKSCFYYKARIQEYKAHILVTNHHLFFSHIATSGKILPHFDTLVFDEAHTLEDVATSYLGIEVSNFQIRYFLDSLFNPQSGKGFLRGINGVARHYIENIRKNVEILRNSTQLFFSEIISKLGEGSKTVRIKEPGLVINYLREPFIKLALSIEGIQKFIQKEDDRIEADSFISRAREFEYILNSIINMRLEKHVYWLDILNRSRWGIKCTFFAAPIDIADEFKKKVLTPINPVILTSATLSVGGSFEFIKRSLGLDTNVSELKLDSPFNYLENAILYVPNHLPSPDLKSESYNESNKVTLKNLSNNGSGDISGCVNNSSSRRDVSALNGNYIVYQEKVIEEIKRIISLMQGRTFVLFTNFRMMDIVYRELKADFSDFCILKQGNAPRYKLVERFKRSSKAVLLGTNTFWQGIDVPGKALECVIISKLPFVVPDEPIAEAKMELLLSQRKNPFIHYQIPRATIMLKQGFGRLIRTQTDRGLVAVLDSRIKTKWYGRGFLKSLPNCRQLTDLKQVEGFFINSK